MCTRRSHLINPATGVFLSLMVLSWGCGSEATLTTSGIDGDRGQGDSASDSDHDPATDFPQPNDGQSQADPGGDGPSSTDVDAAPGPGEFLYPCERDDQCNSGYCIQYGDEYVCSDYCTPDAGCPDGWICRVIENSGADAVRICVPAPDTLCRLCQSNTDCGSRSNLCIEVGGDRVCGRSCELTIDCPDDFYCTERTDPTGIEARQCVPLNEQCTCRPEFDGNSRPCVWQNQHGVCEGVEVCMSEQGWSACTAHEPRPEACDGSDNNCDGQADETLDPRPCFSTPNEIGRCEGTETCLGTQGWLCDARVASIEICNGIDDDCNGTADDGICYDGNDCTYDICRTEGGCDYPPKAGPCNDNSLCTTNDLCVDGTCTGAAVVCNDNNGCTTDSCDPLSGCVFTNANGAPCETGNLCTIDTCQNGVCVSGTPEPCVSWDTCLRARCVSSVGCTMEPLTGNSCDDDDSCTVSDVCSNGSCVGGRPYCQGHACSNCPEESWNISLGAWCVDIFGPTCLCICI